jgi:hypothetical protein
MPKHLAPGKSNEWRTPKSIFDALALVFDLDPCWPLDGPCFVPARQRYTVHDNGLVQSWYGLVWLNPPFGGRAGKTKFIKPDGSVGAEPANGIALIGIGEVANSALLKSGLGFCAPIIAPLQGQTARNAPAH